MQMQANVGSRRKGSSFPRGQTEGQLDAGVQNKSHSPAGAPTLVSILPNAPLKVGREWGVTLPSPSLAGCSLADMDSTCAALSEMKDIIWLTTSQFAPDLSRRFSCSTSWPSALLRPAG